MTSRGDDDLEGNVQYDDAIQLGDSESEDSEGEIQAIPSGIEDGEDEAVADNSVLTSSKSVNAKKRAKLQALRAKKKQRKQEDELRLLPPDEQCSRLWQMYLSATASLGLTLTPVEIEDRKEAFTPSRFVQLPPTRTVEDVSTHIKLLRMEKGNKPSGSEGGPEILIVTYSAMRALAFTKALKNTRQRLRLVKLFSRHMKVEEQKKELLQGCDIAVGTPNRILKLIGIGALSFSRPVCVVVDASKDVKQTTIFDMSTVREDFFKFFHSHIAANTNARICLY